MITSNRNIFLGIHVTPKVKEALKREVIKRREAENDAGVSQSRVGYDLLREALIQQGHEELRTDEIL